jgi:hypothetical protein
MEHRALPILISGSAELVAEQPALHRVEARAHPLKMPILV